MKDEKKETKTFVEEIEVAGDKLVGRVKELAREASVRQVRIIADDGDVFLETPLHVGLVMGGAVALAAPWLAILGAVAGLVTKVRVEVEREVDADESDAKPAVTKEKEGDG